MCINGTIKLTLNNQYSVCRTEIAKRQMASVHWNVIFYIFVLI
jgi:hypothetical protein